MSPRKTTLAEAAAMVLSERGPTHYSELMNQILARELVKTSAKDPGASLRSVLCADVKHKGSQSTFVRVSRAVFGLRSLHASGEDSGDVPSSRPSATRRLADTFEGDKSRRVRLPLFPKYGEVRRLLNIWAGRPKAQITGLHKALDLLRGTPQDPVDWTDPDAWIPKRLSGDSLDIAKAIWTGSDRTVNPRHTRGHWFLIQKYGLLEERPDGSLVLTDGGRDFVERETGESVAFLDGQDGLTELLGIVSDRGPARHAGLIGPWGEYLRRHSKFASESVIRDSLTRRLANLLDRSLVDRERARYSVTPAGRAYLEGVGPSEDELKEIRGLALERERSVRAAMKKHLLEMAPAAFEQLVGRLLEEMGYQNVAVIGQPGDGGVDVVADLELGVSSVREVVQAKRHKRTIQRKDLDALRGSLHRFDAVRGTIVTTSRFASGALNEAFAKGVAPITLIDGDALIDILIEHGLGVRKRTIEVLELDSERLAESSDLIGARTLTEDSAGS